MKAVILAGGFGTRLSEETSIKPKPMVEIGNKPILWHILKIYSHYGINDFVICCGYKGYMIKEFFSNYFLYSSDITFNMKDNKMEVHSSFAEPWNITLVDTGEKTMTGGRLKRISKYINNETFCFTYGDGVSNLINPTLGGLIAMLSMCRVPLDKWLRFIFPVVIIVFLLSAITLIVAVTIGYQ